MTRFYEMTNVYDRGPVDINERSQQIQTQFGQGLTCLYHLVSNHRLSFTNVPIQALSTGKSIDMYIYRFRQENSQESSQTCMGQVGTRPRPIAYVSMPKRRCFTVVII